ncbi:hypothetical protein D5086_024746 [Populus alba]|uniref:Uncharacterized protein n=1 Tax=Populus alba TaxID=43335 RepID=A0ACC4B6C7_POPAL
MPRPTTGGWYLFLRSFCSSIHPQLPNSTPEATDLFNKVRVLSTRGNIKEALSFFYSTPQLNQSQQTYATLFHACARHGNLKQGQYLHQHMISKNPKNPQDLFVTNHLINMYAKCGDLDCARQVFDEMGRRNVVSWTALISGYAQHGRSYECFSLFSDMLVDCYPNEFAFASVITSCDYVCGKQVHALALKMGLIASVYVGNALITRYSKSCEDNFVGDGSEACRVFESMEFRNLVSWNSMIAAFQHWKLGGLAIGIFFKMHSGGVEFDGATLVSVLSSLSESYDGDNADVGLKGCFQLHCVSIKRGFMLKIELATALVKAYSDLGGKVSDCYRLFMETSRAGLLLEAGELISRMPMKPDSVVWSALLSSCRKYGETQLAKLAADKLKELEPGNSLGYVQISNIYCSGGSYNEAGLIRDEMNGSRVRKEPGLSWIEIENRVHEFASGGRRHPQREAIYAKLYSLIGQLKGILLKPTQFDYGMHCLSWNIFMAVTTIDPSDWSNPQYCFENLGTAEIPRHHPYSLTKNQGSSDLAPFLKWAENQDKQ